MSTMNAAPGKVVLEIEGAVGSIILDNPARMNALNMAMWRALPEAVEQANADHKVRVIVLSGRGDKAFSAGADISEFDEARTGEARGAYDDLNSAAFAALLNSAKPIVAAINGFCLGGGLELALCCDLRVAAEGSIFGIPAARLGIGYNPRWVRPLLSAMSAASAKELLFTGSRFDCTEALRMGIVNRVYSREDFDREARSFVDIIAANAPLSVRAAKAAIDEFSHSPENPDYARLDALVEACFNSTDYAEGRAAFKEKRKPVFRGE